MPRKYTIRQFETQFPDDKACLAFLFKARWPQGVTCARCERVADLEQRIIADRPWVPALDRLILEVRAEMPCYWRWNEEDEIEPDCPTLAVIVPSEAEPVTGDVPILSGAEPR